MTDASFRTKPNPNQPERCPSIDPHDALQCGRRSHEDDQCQYGGIGWKKGAPRYVSAEERLASFGDVLTKAADSFYSDEYIGNLLRTHLTTVTPPELGNPS